MGSAAQFPKEGRPTALFLGHPGHELRVYGWSCLVRPQVYILTDGSGATGMSRLARTTSLLSLIGARPGIVYGRLTDQGIYQAMMDGEASRFTDMVDELARAWIEDGIEVVASDANEGYNPTHDLCCEMAQAATELVYWETGRQIRLYSFCLTEWENSKTEDFRRDAICVRLSDAVCEDKIAAARSYSELAKEVDRALASKGIQYFREEYLFPASGYADRDATYKPSYERFGELRVAEGKYASVLRYGRHVLPIFEKLRNHVSLRSADRVSLGA
jgi:hypothetical protein